MSGLLAAERHVPMFSLGLYSDAGWEWGPKRRRVGGKMQCKTLGKINYFILFKGVKGGRELSFEFLLYAQRWGVTFYALLLFKLHNNPSGVVFCITGSVGFALLHSCFTAAETEVHTNWANFPEATLLVNDGVRMHIVASHTNAQDTLSSMLSQFHTGREKQLRDKNGTDRKKICHSGCQNKLQNINF